MSRAWSDKELVFKSLQNSSWGSIVSILSNFVWGLYVSIVLHVSLETYWRNFPNSIGFKIEVFSPWNNWVRRTFTGKNSCRALLVEKWFWTRFLERKHKSFSKISYRSAGKSIDQSVLRVQYLCLGTPGWWLWQSIAGNLLCHTIASAQNTARLKASLDLCVLSSMSSRLTSGG